MSVRLMSQVFGYQFPQRVEYVSKDMTFSRDKETHKPIPGTEHEQERIHATTGASCKAVLLALADHANDDGIGAYPSTATICKKTNLTTPTVISALLALRYHLFMVFVGTSPRETNSYNLCPDRLEIEFGKGGKATLPVGVNPLYRGGKATLPESSFNPPQPPLNNNEPMPETKPNIYSLYESNIGPLVPLIADKLRDAEKEYPQEWIEKAFERAVARSARNWAFVSAVLVGMKTNGVDWKPEKGNYANNKPNYRTQRPVTPAPIVTDEQRALARQILAGD
jgi:hypothetical protein